LSFGVPSAGNPSRIQTDHTEIPMSDMYQPGRSLLKRWHTRVR